MAATAEDRNLQQLKRTRKWATASLVAMAVLLFVSRTLEVSLGWHWMEYVHAFAEAAVVGGLADWFAVTALFRYPLGIRVPHTAIIPNKQSSIARGIGQFVENNFLNPETLDDKLRNFDAVTRAENWLARPENAASIADRITRFLPELLEGLDDENVQEFLRSNLTVAVEQVDAGKLAGQALGAVVENDEEQKLFAELLRFLRQTLDENEDEIRDLIKAESPRLLRGLVERQVIDRVVNRLNKGFDAMARNPEHPARKRFYDSLRRTVSRLETDPEYSQGFNRAKQDLLYNPQVQHYIQRLWLNAKARITADASNRDSEIRDRLYRGIYGLANNLLKDEAVRNQLNNYLYEVATNALAANRKAISGLITETVENWDRSTLVDKLEIQVGKDLQFIRINGTLVGGLVGLLLHIAAQFIGWL